MTAALPPRVVVGAFKNKGRQYDKTIQPPCGRGNAPLLPPAAASPPEGEILATLCFEMLMRTNAERREDFPLRGKWCAAPIGVHFHVRSPVCMFFNARRAVFKVLS